MNSFHLHLIQCCGMELEKLHKNFKKTIKTAKPHTVHISNMSYLDGPKKNQNLSEFDETLANEILLNTFNSILN